MKISDEGLNYIISVLDFKSTPILYDEKQKIYMIGFNHEITQKEYEQKFKDQQITKEKAIEILKKDIEILERYLFFFVRTKLTQNQFDLLILYMLEMGVHNFSKSEIVYYLNKEKYKSAADAILKYIFINGEISNNLLKRRIKERNKFLL